ncbi:hypothetical protein [Actinoplanes sp. GCM10030250]|uniref:hypothetical protein n=1 Tax=Actinoplanes sp. GCM10030250 TaxID=3273376 RepID=UPI00361DEDAF
MTLRAALDALRKDSASWEHAASVTAKAGDEAAALYLGAVDLSWASLPSGLLNTYIELQNKAVRLLGEATQVYTDLSLALDKVALSYEVNDEQAAQEFKGVWEVRD